MGHFKTQNTHCVARLAPSPLVHVPNTCVTRVGSQNKNRKNHKGAIKAALHFLPSQSLCSYLLRCLPCSITDKDPNRWKTKSVDNQVFDFFNLYNNCIVGGWVHHYEWYLTFPWPSPLRPIYIFLSRCDVSIARLFKETFRGRDKDTFSGQCIRLTHIADGDLFRVCFAPCASAKWVGYTSSETKGLFINIIVSCSPSRKFEAYAQYK